MIASNFAFMPNILNNTFAESPIVDLRFDLSTPCKTLILENDRTEIQEQQASGSHRGVA